MQTITIRGKGVLDASMGLEATGIDYFVNGGQGRGTKIWLFTEKREKDSLHGGTRLIVQRNTPAEGQTVRGIHQRDHRNDCTTCGDDRTYIFALF